MRGCASSRLTNSVHGNKSACCAPQRHVIHANTKRAVRCKSVNPENVAPDGLHEAARIAVAELGAGCDEAGSIEPTKLPPDSWLQHMQDAYRKAWRRKQVQPLFLLDYPVPPGKKYTHNSFAGKYAPLGGKYYVPPEKYYAFAVAYVDHPAQPNAAPLLLTENYHNKPHRYFQELDFDFNYDRQMVQALGVQLVQLITDNAVEFFGLPSRPKCIISMRSIYKIHFVFPDVVTTEEWSIKCRNQLVSQCKKAFGASLLDWDRVVDHPHGSLRMLGSLKPPRLQKDPSWLKQKAYKVVRLVQGSWQTVRLTPRLLHAASILPTQLQMDLFDEKYPDRLETKSTSEPTTDPPCVVYSGQGGDRLVGSQDWPAPRPPAGTKLVQVRFTMLGS